MQVTDIPFTISDLMAIFLPWLRYRYDKHIADNIAFLKIADTHNPDNELIVSKREHY
jgi:hypothetical protein